MFLLLLAGEVVTSSRYEYAFRRLLSRGAVRGKGAGSGSDTTTRVSPDSPKKDPLDRSGSQSPSSELDPELTVIDDAEDAETGSGASPVVASLCFSTESGEVFVHRLGRNVSGSGKILGS